MGARVLSRPKLLLRVTALQQSESIHAMSMAPVTTKDNADKCPRSGLTPEAMLVPEGS